MPRETVRCDRRKLKRFLTRSVPAMLSGRIPDRYGLARACLLRAAAAALADVLGDFDRKSQGGAGEDGITWEPLAPYTLKRRSGAEPGRSGVPGGGGADAGNPAVVEFQRTRAEIYREEYQRLRRGGLPAKEARRQASITAKFLARSAWQRGADARKARGIAGQPGDEPGDFPILNESGRLRASLSPGVLSGSGLAVSYGAPAEPGYQPGDQKLTLSPGRVVVESLTGYGDTHLTQGYGSDTGGFRPARVWNYPSPPDSWKPRWASAYRKAVAELVPHAVKRWVSDGQPNLGG